MKKWLAVVFAIVFLCSSMTAWAAEVKELPNNITRLEDDPAADKPDYEIHVNRALNYTVVYAQDPVTGEFTVPVIKFANSTGRDNRTPLGKYAITKKHRWREMFGRVYTQYAVRFMTHIMFHSAYYTEENDNSTLNWKEYNKLGQQASSGCVRETVIDSKWLYDNCKIGTPVIVYDDPDDPGPFGELHVVTIPADSPYQGWDPTDPDPDNPWQELRPVLYIAFHKTSEKTLELPVGATEQDLYASFGLAQADGTPYAPETTELGLVMPYALEIYGLYDLNTPGQYEIYVRGFDLATTLRADETFVLQVTP